MGRQGHQEFAGARMRGSDGKKTYWCYLPGFYAGLVFHNVITFRLIERLWGFK